MCKYFYWREAHCPRTGYSCGGSRRWNEPAGAMENGREKCSPCREESTKGPCPLTVPLHCHPPTEGLGVKPFLLWHLGVPPYLDN